jgi:hypothetical protein
MMELELKLRPLPIFNLPESILKRPLEKLRQITQRNEFPRESRQFTNRKNELIRRLKNGESFKQATDVLGRERLLLSIYIQYLNLSEAKKWLPDFNEGIAESILGISGSSWHLGRRRQVALLFFTHFDRIKALSFVSSRLAEAYATTDSTNSEPSKTWHLNRELIFHPSGPENIANQFAEPNSFDELRARYAIPNNGRFIEALRQFVLISGLNKVNFGHTSRVFPEIENQKEERISPEFLLGAKALKTLVNRVAGEGRGVWPDGWTKWLTRFGCDPRYAKNTAVFSKWWWWATQAELRLAQRAMVGLDLSFFIKFLRNQLTGAQNEEHFRLRSRFLLALFEKGKIVDARLLLNASSFRDLQAEYRNPLSVAKLDRTPPNTSIICLKCVDGIFIIEGTHNFALRVFKNQFPVAGFWEFTNSSYLDSNFRISLNQCPIFIRQTLTGSWINIFFDRLRTTFHVEWDDIGVNLQ